MANLLRAAGPREQAPSDCARRVEVALRAEWRAAVRRHDRRRARWIAAGAVATAAALTLILQTQPWSTSQAPSASVSPTPANLRHDVRYDERVPDGGLPRRILVNYAWESR